MYVAAYCDNVKLILFDLNQTDAEFLSCILSFFVRTFVED